MTEEEIDEVLQELVNKGLVSFKVYESGEKYYFITEEGKEVLDNADVAQQAGGTGLKIRTVWVRIPLSAPIKAARNGCFFYV